MITTFERGWAFVVALGGFGDGEEYCSRRW